MMLHPTQELEPPANPARFSLKDLTLLHQKGLSIHSADRGKVSKAVLTGHIARAQAESVARAARTTQQHAAGSSRKNKSSAARAEARRKGTFSNIMRKEQRIREVADFINATPGAENMTRQQLVDTLNNAGIQNLRSVRGEVRIPWTKEALRPVQKAAQELITGEAEMDCEEVALAKEQARSDTQPLPEGTPEHAEKSTSLPVIQPNALMDCLEQALKDDTSVPRALSTAERILLQECIRRKLMGAGMQADVSTLKRQFPLLVKALEPTSVLVPRVLMEMHRVFEDRLRSHLEAQ